MWRRGVVAGRCPSGTGGAGTGKAETDSGRRGRRRERCGWDARRLEGGAGAAGSRKGVAGTAGAEVDGGRGGQRAMVTGGMRQWPTRGETWLG